MDTKRRWWVSWSTPSCRWVVNPRQVRDFARAIGQLAKTDAFYTLACWHCSVNACAILRSPTL